VKQVIRSSGSVGANYIEAQEAFSKKDFYHRIKICRKEAKESNYWLELIVLEDSETESTKNQKNKLAEEAIELTKIFGQLLIKTRTNNYLSFVF
jgi:four helix bundle protein